MVPDIKIARAVAEQAANVHMRKAGRKTWSAEDAAVAEETLIRMALHIPLAEGGLDGVPLEMLHRDYPFLANREPV